MPATQIADVQRRWVQGRIDWMGVKEIVRHQVPKIRDRRRTLALIGKIA